jgi:hypothetical protein
VTVSLPQVLAAPNKNVTIPLRLDNLMGEPVSSYQFTVEFDPSVIRPLNIAADLAGTLADGMTIAYHSPRRGVVNVVVYSPFPVSGEGEYINLNFHISGAPGTSTPLSISGFRFNDGKVQAVESNGSVKVGK